MRDLLVSGIVQGAHILVDYMRSEKLGTLTGQIS